MKNFALMMAAILFSVAGFTQIGVGTTSPNSTLDVRGSISTNYRTFNASTSASITDNVLVFTGTAAATLTLPSAASITGRSYRIKNASLTGPTPTLTVATASSQTIDGLTSWTLNELYQTVTIVSNGSNWNIVSFLPSSSAISWSQTGNANINAAINYLGTSDDRAMIIKSNNSSYLEFGRRQTLGLTQAGFTDYTDNNEMVTYVRSALQFEAANASFYKPKMFTDVDGNFRVKGSSAGTDYFEFGSTGTSNNGGFEFIIGDDGDEPILFKSYHYINGMSEIMRLQSGRMAVGSNAFNGTNPEKLLIDAGATTSYNLMTGKGSIDNYLQINVQNRSNGSIASSDLVATADNGSETTNYIDMGINSSGYGNTGILGGANTAYLFSAANDFVLGNTSSGRNMIFFTGGSTATNERMRITGTGNVGIGISTFNATNPEKLLVDAGTAATSYNVISGKGTINNYLQLNIQNRSNGTAASSDIVATADNGSETVNFVNLGINSSGYGSSGILSGVNNAYLYTTGNDFIIGNSTNNRSLIFYTTTSGSNIERMRITNAGLIPGQDNTYSAGNTTNRWTAVWAANGTIQTSDQRLKKNILPLAYGLNELMQLNPVSYDWKDNSGAQKIGLIAQDVKKIIPQVVIGNEEKENLGMNYAELVPVLINAIKELKGQVDRLEAQAKKKENK